MVGVDMTCGKGAGPESTYSLCSPLYPHYNLGSSSHEHYHTHLKVLKFPHLRTAQTDQEERTGGLPITQDACPVLP